MPWQLLVGLYIISGSIVAKALIKRFSTSPARIQWLVGQYVLCVLFSFIYLWFSHTPFQFPLFLLFFGIGIVSSMSTYAQWRALDMSMSVTSLLTPAGGLIALLLGFSFLGEHRYLNAGLITGLIASFAAAILFAFSKVREGFTRSTRVWQFARYIALMSVMAGGVTFLMRWFALEGVGLPLYMSGWYSGTFAGSLILYGWKGRTVRFRATKQDYLFLILLALSIWASKALIFTALGRAPIAVVEPLVQVIEIIFPSLLGLFVFREAIALSTLQKYSFALGAAGSILIALNY